MKGQKNLINEIIQGIVYYYYQEFQEQCFIAPRIHRNVGVGINETSHINASLNILVNHMVNAATDPVKWLDPAALRSPCPVSGAGCTHCYPADYRLETIMLLQPGDGTVI